MIRIVKLKGTSDPDVQTSCNCCHDVCAFRVETGINVRSTASLRLCKPCAVELSGHLFLVTK